MNPAYLAVVIAVLLACAPLLSSTTPRQRRKALDRYARRMNLALTPEVEPRVIGRVAAYERATLIGGVIGSVVGLAVGRALPPAPDSGTWTPLAVLVGLGVGAMVATVTTATVGTLHHAPGRRVARISAPTMNDYVPPLERWFAPTALACAGLALLGAAIALSTGVVQSPDLSAADVFSSPGAVFGYLGAAGFLTARLLGHRILGAGQPAADQHELAWDDALRAATLRGLLTLPGALSTLSVLTTFLRLGAHVTNPPEFVGVIGGAALMLFICGVVMLATVDAFSRPSQHYWRQLWQPARGSR